ncbi:MAG: zinc ribbon domain-containing protein [Acidobacteriota bacterium]
MLTGKLRNFFTHHIGRLTIASVLLLLLLTVALVIVRNSVESELVQRAALDLPLLKNRWPGFKKAVEQLHTPITDTLTQSEPLAIPESLSEMMRQIISSHTYNLVGDDGRQGKMIAHIEIVFFERDTVRPKIWYWLPAVDTGLTATELYSRVSWQQLQQTQLLTANGAVTEAITPMSLINQPRALLIFYLHTEWNYREGLIKALLRATQVGALLSVLLIALWIYTFTHKRSFAILIVIMALLGLIAYSSLTLKALSLRTVLSMLITLQFGPNANRAADFSGLSMLVAAGFGLLMLGLLYLPARPACPNCGRNVNDDYRFCPFCNHTLKRNCTHCSAAVDTSWNYCPSCSKEI